MESTKVVEKIQKDLFAMQDLTYRDFHKHLIPTVDEETIIGVRTPDLRKYAKKLARTQEAQVFLSILPHTYYEEDNLHAFLIEQIRDYDTCVAELDRFLPFVDNWATCDMMSVKLAKKYSERFLGEIERWLHAEDTYSVRFGIEMLMKFYLDDLFSEDYLRQVAETSSNEYYVNMMRAWYFATALAKQYASTLPYIQEKCLDVWTHNKSIQKAIESKRLSKEQKEYLKTLKVKGK